MRFDMALSVAELATIRGYRRAVFEQTGLGGAHRQARTAVAACGAAGAIVKGPRRARLRAGLPA